MWLGAEGGLATMADAIGPRALGGARSFRLRAAPYAAKFRAGYPATRIEGYRL
jgi:hypothetical protein